MRPRCREFRRSLLIWLYGQRFYRAHFEVDAVGLNYRVMLNCLNPCAGLMYEGRIVSVAVSFDPAIALAEHAHHVWER